MVQNSIVRKTDTLQRKHSIYSLAYYCLFLFLFLCLLLFGGTLSNVIKIIVLVSICASFLFVSKTKILLAYFFFYPFSSLFKIDGIGSSLFNVLTIVAIFFLLFEWKKTIVLSKGFLIKVVLIVFLSFLAIAAGYTYSNSNLLFDVISNIVVPFVFLLCVFEKRNKIVFSTVAFGFSLGLIISGLCGCGYIPIPNLNSFVTFTVFRLGDIRFIRFAGLTNNPNYFSLEVNLGLACVLGVIIREKRKDIFSYIIALLLVFIGLMTLSKSFVFGLIFTLVLILIELRKSIYNFLFFSILLVLIISLVFLLSNEYFEALFLRFSSTSDSLDSLTSLRWSIWQYYLAFFVNNPISFLFGRGLNAEAIYNYNGFNYATHSFYLECLFYFGLVGTSIVVYILSSFIFSKSNKKKQLIAFVPLLVFLFRAIAINVVSRSVFLAALTLSILSIYNNERQS